MEQSERYPSYVVSVANALSTSMHPLSMDALVDKVRGQRPISKGVRSAVYRALKQLYQAVPVAPGQFGWLSHLLRDNVVRHPLAGDEVRRGFLLLDELEHAVFFPQFFQTHRPDSRHLTIELLGGPTLRAEAAVERRTWSLRLGAPFAEWIDEMGGQGRDDIIIVAGDVSSGEYTFRLQPHEARDEDNIRDRNLQVALAAEELVADLRRAEKTVPTWELAAMLIGRGLFADPVPPDDLHMVLQRYSMLALSNGLGYRIRDHSDADSGRAAKRTPYATTVDDSFGSPMWRPDDDGDNDDELDADELDVDELHVDDIPHGSDDRDNGNGVTGSRYQPEFFGDGSEDDACQDYEDYLEQFKESGVPGGPLSHGDYHLLEAELEMLVSLEQEFGYLLPEQQTRVDELADRLFIDPDALLSDEQDSPDEGDYDGPTYWQN